MRLTMGGIYSVTIYALFNYYQSCLDVVGLPPPPCSKRINYIKQGVLPQRIQPNLVKNIPNWSHWVYHKIPWHYIHSQKHASCNKSVGILQELVTNTRMCSHGSQQFVTTSLLSTDLLHVDYFHRLLVTCFNKL